ncbi:UDP-N-acetylmuramoyl-tripeptide--D-alanyl-D-alanine ligase [Crenothrix sp.]|uniref:UDP-N-acetylmuramoyl-tripeptide--D-alanyl-D- alanine ligase n=1 Tax=Crenothrix sp. TaxID=3100433 RepID=UPI00374D0D74
MMLSDIAKSVQGELFGDDIIIEAVSLDTRTLKSGELYIAIEGKNFDGNQFIAAAMQKGAAAAILRKGITAAIPYIAVDDTHLALAELAGAWRRRVATSVVGVTGSNGKTTVKEMTAAILAVKGSVLFTQGNLNNDIGVPLTLLRLQEQHRFAVIEMGANHPCEIEYTSTYAQADVVILNNAGAAHIEGFGSLNGVAKAKGEIIETLKQKGIAILNKDDSYFDYWQGIAGNRKVISFGLNDTADLFARAIKTECTAGFVTSFELVTATSSLTVQLKLAGRHNVLNALAAAAAGLALGLDLKMIKQGLESVNPVKGRLQPVVSRLGNLVIDDTYNANSSSLAVGLDVLANCPGKPWLVLGAFGELGPQSAKMHEDMGHLIKDKGVVRLLAVGADAKNTVHGFGEGGQFFETQADLLTVLQRDLGGDETILVKGSRAQRMENIVAALVEIAGIA